MPVETTLIGSWDYRLVAQSVFLATLASYAALDLAARTHAAHGRIRTVWIVGGGFQVNFQFAEASPQLP